MVDESEAIIVYTDGGCDPNPGVGGWGAVLLYEDHRKELSGGAAKTTNNRMELTAAIEALGSLKRASRVILHTDSEYLKKGITEWMPRWRAKGWRRKGGALKNVDLWKRLDELASEHRVEWAWVPGHAGIEENERCDELAKSEIARLKG